MSMPTCPSCIYAQGICEKTGVKIRYSTGCTYHKPKRITNADRLRSMSDEEFATAICKHGGCPFREAEDDECLKHHYDCKACWLDWLRQKVKEGEC